MKKFFNPLQRIFLSFEPVQDQCFYGRALHTGMTQTIMGISPVWLGSLLCALFVTIGFLPAYHVDSDQTVQMPRLIWVFAWVPDLFVGFLMCRLFNIDPFCCTYTWGSIWKYGNIAYFICLFAALGHLSFSLTDVTCFSIAVYFWRRHKSKYYYLCFVLYSDFIKMISWFP